MEDLIALEAALDAVAGWGAEGGGEKAEGEDGGDEEVC